MTEEVKLPDEEVIALEGVAQEEEVKSPLASIVEQANAEDDEKKLEASGITITGSRVFKTEEEVEAAKEEMARKWCLYVAEVIKKEGHDKRFLDNLSEIATEKDDLTGDLMLHTPAGVSLRYQINFDEKGEGREKILYRPEDNLEGQKFNDIAAERIVKAAMLAGMKEFNITPASREEYKEMVWLEAEKANAKAYMEYVKDHKTGVGFEPVALMANFIPKEDSDIRKKFDEEFKAIAQEVGVDMDRKDYKIFNDKVLDVAQKQKTQEVKQAEAVAPAAVEEVKTVKETAEERVARVSKEIADIKQATAKVDEKFKLEATLQPVENGVKRWVIESVNEDGSVKVQELIEKPNGAKERKVDGKLHCEYGPADERVEGAIRYLRDGQLQSIDGNPAVLKNDGTEMWFDKDVRHNDKGPAVVKVGVEEKYYLDGKIYNDQQLYKAELAKFAQENGANVVRRAVNNRPK